MNRDPMPTEPLKIHVTPAMARKLSAWANREYQPFSTFLRRLLSQAIQREEERIGCSLLDVTLSSVEE